MRDLGRLMVVMGGILVLFGLLVTFQDRLPLRIGRLPGDIVIRGKNSVFYFPLATSLLLSVVLSLILWLIGRR
ncbi:MAG: DUF2905 domain-containing protein [Bryobacteraceae bacterium]|nr:DUF2905 domain-containing protein [Bryobacteraceae bacterium]